MEQLDPHTCPLCYGDLALFMAGKKDVAVCEDCGTVYATDWDMDGDSEGTSYFWSWTGAAPPPSALFDQSYVPDARAAS